MSKAKEYLPPIEVDKVIHGRVRLGIMGVLSVEGEVEFTALKQFLSVSDGNLNAHLKVLEEADYILVSKKFVNRKPKTTYKHTEKGKAQFRKYIGFMEGFIKDVS